MERTAAVVVLGDLARSPRMRAHAAALAADGWRVVLIGHLEHAIDAPGVELAPLADPLAERARGARGPRRLAWMALRLVQSAVSLLRALFNHRPDVVLVQNPPALPTLAVARLACLALGARLVVDWHNFGRAMLALKLGPDALVVRIAGWLERALARGADAHMCVTQAMSRELAGRWGIPSAQVLPDLPRANGWTRAAARARLAELVALPHVNAFVVVTATSWTLDEDPALLVDALDRCAARGSAGAAAFVVMSGRGPERAAFEERLTARPAGAPRVELVWVADADYPALLRGADAGVSLHRSASGVDFPMKIVDMRAAGLPVLAFEYAPTLFEGFREGCDGFAFRDAAQLADLLDRMMTGAPLDVSLAQESWPERWNQVARPLLTGSWPVRENM